MVAGLVQDGRPLFEQYLHAWREARLVLCDCAQGQSKRRWLTRLSEQHVSDAEQLAVVAQRVASQRRQQLFDDAGVPEKFLGYTWESFKNVAGKEAGKQGLITAIEAYQQTGHLQTNEGLKWGIFVYGKSDLGKTGALSQLFLHYLKQGAGGLWVQYNTLLRELRNFNDGHVDDRVNQCKRVEYLFIDDFGDPLTKGEVSNYSRDVMMQIIDYRNNYAKPMFITSNLNLDELAVQYHGRIVKRLLESCFVVEVTGKALGVLKR